MSFKDEYTTADKILSESTLDIKDLPETKLLERDKIVISNDAMAIGQLLECLINKGLR